MDRQEMVRRVIKALRGIPADQIDGVMAEAKAQLGAPGQAVAGPKKKVEDALLQLVGTVKVLASEAFKVSNLFVVDMSETAQVKVSSVGNSFIPWFGEMIVGTHSGSTLSYHTLRRNAYDRDIIAALGGEERVETSLAEILWLMSQQKNDENEVLLHNGYTNIFYVRDRSSALRAVYVGWSVSGWCVSAFELGFINWVEGRRVFVPSASSSVGSSC